MRCCVLLMYICKLVTWTTLWSVTEKSVYCALLVIIPQKCVTLLNMIFHDQRGQRNDMTHTPCAYTLRQLHIAAFKGIIHACYYHECIDAILPVYDLDNPYLH